MGAKAASGDQVAADAAAGLLCPADPTRSRPAPPEAPISVFPALRRVSPSAAWSNGRRRGGSVSAIVFPPRVRLSILQCSENDPASQMATGVADHPRHRFPGYASAAKGAAIGIPVLSGSVGDPASQMVADVVVYLRQRLRECGSDAKDTAVSIRVLGRISGVPADQMAAGVADRSPPSPSRMRFTSAFARSSARSFSSWPAWPLIHSQVT